MHGCVTALAKQDALLDFLAQPLLRPTSHRPPRRILVNRIDMMRVQCARIPIVFADDALSTKSSDDKLSVSLAFLRRVFGVAPTADVALSSIEVGRLRCSACTTAPSNVALKDDPATWATHGSQPVFS
jgi:hypothetical protein